MVAIAFALRSKQLRRASLVPSLRLPIAQGRENEVASFQRLTFSARPRTARRDVCEIKIATDALDEAIRIVPGSVIAPAVGAVGHEFRDQTHYVLTVRRLGSTLSAYTCASKRADIAVARHERVLGSRRAVLNSI